MKEVSIKQSLVPPPDLAYIQEMSLELSNGAAKFIDYKFEESDVRKVLERFLRQKRDGVYNSQED